LTRATSSLSLRRAEKVYAIDEKLPEADKVSEMRQPSFRKESTDF